MPYFVISTFMTFLSAPPDHSPSYHHHHHSYLRTKSYPAIDLLGSRVKTTALNTHVQILLFLLREFDKPGLYEVFSLTNVWQVHNLLSSFSSSDNQKHDSTDTESYSVHTTTWPPARLHRQRVSKGEGVVGESQWTASKRQDQLGGKWNFAHKKGFIWGHWNIYLYSLQWARHGSDKFYCHCLW